MDRFVCEMPKQNFAQISVLTFTTLLVIIDHQPIRQEDLPVNANREHIPNIEGFKLRVLLVDGRKVETEVVYGLIEGCEYPFHHLKAVRIKEVVAWERIEEKSRVE